MTSRPPLPFIPTQRLFRLTVPWEQAEEWLRPERFRRLRRLSEQQDAVVDGSLELAGDSKGSNDGAWVEVSDRWRLCVDPTLHRLCVLDDAGMGKTKALQQIEYARHEADHGALCIRVEFQELPQAFTGYLGRNAEDARSIHDPPFLVQRFQALPGLSSLGGDEVWRFLQRKIRQGKFTLLVDALEQSNEAEHPNKLAGALADFLITYPQVRCWRVVSCFAWRLLHGRCRPLSVRVPRSRVCAPHVPHHWFACREGSSKILTLFPSLPLPGWHGRPTPNVCHGQEFDGDDDAVPKDEIVDSQPVLNRDRCIHWFNVNR